MSKPKSMCLAYPSSVVSYLADSFPPRGKLKGTPPKGSTKACCLGNLPLWGKVAEPQVLTDEGLGGFLLEQRQS